MESSPTEAGTPNLQRVTLGAGLRLRASVGAESQFFQLQLDGMVARRLGVDFGVFVVLKFQSGGDNFPAGFAPVNFKAVLDALPALELGASQRHENPLIAVEAMQGLHLAVRNANGMGIFIDGFDPWLFAHGLASVIEKAPKLVCTNDRPHNNFVTADGPFCKGKRRNSGQSCTLTEPTANHTLKV